MAQKKKKTPPAKTTMSEREKVYGAGGGSVEDAPETWITCGMTLCPSEIPPPSIRSSNASAAQAVFVAVPRATRTMQRFVMGEKYFTFFFFFGFATTKQGGWDITKSNINTGKEGGKEKKKFLTRERRSDFSPTDISKVQQHALL